MLSKEAIIEFQEIYLKEYGEVLAFDEAASRAEGFLRFFKAIVKPTTIKDLGNGSTGYPSATVQ